MKLLTAVLFVALTLPLFAYNIDNKADVIKAVIEM